MKNVNAQQDAHPCDPRRLSGSMTAVFAPCDPIEPYAAPRRHYPGDAGYDLTVSRDVIVYPKSFAQLPANVRIALPPGHWCMILGRSSSFHRKGLMTNVAVIDNGWRGPIFGLVYNPTSRKVIVRAGERIFQLVVFPLITPSCVEVSPEEFPPGDRGEKGFGSTGDP